MTPPTVLWRNDLQWSCSSSWDLLRTLKCICSLYIVWWACFSPRQASYFTSISSLHSSVCICQVLFRETSQFLYLLGFYPRKTHRFWRNTDLLWKHRTVHVDWRGMFLHCQPPWHDVSFKHPVFKKREMKHYSKIHLIIQFFLEQSSYIWYWHYGGVCLCALDKQKYFRQLVWKIFSALMSGSKIDSAQDKNK